MFDRPLGAGCNDSPSVRYQAFPLHFEFFFGFMPLKLYQLIGCFEILYLTRGYWNFKISSSCLFLCFNS